MRSTADAPAPPTYLPALEGAARAWRVRRGAHCGTDTPPAGVRRDRRLHGRHANRRSAPWCLAGRPSALLLQPGSGSAFWYLALKNWVIASGIHPHVVFVFFRDTNLTDVLFRLDEQFRWSLDRVAHDQRTS